VYFGGDLAISDGRECERMRFESCVLLGERGGAAAMQKEGEC